MNLQGPAASSVMSPHPAYASFRVRKRPCGKRAAGSGQIVAHSERSDRAMKVGLPSIEERRGPRRACFPETAFFCLYRWIRQLLANACLTWGGGVRGSVI